MLDLALVDSARKLVPLTRGRLVTGRRFLSMMKTGSAQEVHMVLTAWGLCRTFYLLRFHIHRERVSDFQVDTSTMQRLGSWCRLHNFLAQRNYPATLYLRAQAELKSVRWNTLYGEKAEQRFYRWVDREAAHAYLDNQADQRLAQLGNSRLETYGDLALVGDLVEGYRRGQAYLVWVREKNAALGLDLPATIWLEQHALPAVYLAMTPWFLDLYESGKVPPRTAKRVEAVVQTFTLPGILDKFIATGVLG